ncbi:MAG: pilus assembly protein N-terminal domain-containing protein [Pirellulales bacterium]|nr:pilus assembly protein N-terminal domain-containing protein [Pirellulales bacterium]
MYARNLPRTVAHLCRLSISYSFKSLFAISVTGLLVSSNSYATNQADVIRNITQPTERLELTVNSSRILTLDKRIPRVVVNNPELITATPISATQVQLAARKPGVTQINLWDEEGKVFTVDVMIYGDVRELQHALKRLFPNSSVKVVRLTNSLVLEGFVERPEAVSPILRLAEDYAPKIINNITVGGVQQIMLKVKVMEVSRTKLRTLGVDWAHVSSSGSVVASSISGLITNATTSGGTASVVSGGSAAGETFKFSVVDGNNAFFGFLEALQKNNLAKILADPTLTAVSGRPAHFNVGGELPIIIPSGLGQTTVEYKKFGTQVDFLPIVLGNGNIRLEVRPRVSELDDTRSVNVGTFSVPALKVREVDTGVELKAGQTLALAGLVQTRIDAQERGLPFLSNLPYIGSAFRKVSEEVNEIELLILVTPEFVDGLDAHEVPPCGPGMETVSPSNSQLYFGGHLEVPSCGPCGPGVCGHYGSGCQSYGGASGMIIESDAQPVPMQQFDQPAVDQGMPAPADIEMPTPIEESIDPGPSAQVKPSRPLLQPAETASSLVRDSHGPDPKAMRQQSSWRANPVRNQMSAQFSRDNPKYQTSDKPVVSKTASPGLIGPIGYDVEK